MIGESRQKVPISQRSNDDRAYSKPVQRPTNQKQCGWPPIGGISLHNSGIGVTTNDGEGDERVQSLSASGLAGLLGCAPVKPGESRPYLRLDACSVTLSDRTPRPGVTPGPKRPASPTPGWCAVVPGRR